MHLRAGTVFRRIILQAPILTAAVVATVWVGCAAFGVPDEPRNPTPIQPVWSEDELEDHLKYLNSGEAAKRTTGTQGYARAAAYVAARMREFNLQPALEGEFRNVYSTSINYPLSAVFRTVAGTDSVMFYPGIDMLADGRSDSGSVSVQTIVITDDTTGVGAAPRTPFAVLFREGGVSDETLARWRSAGAVLAITVESLTPRFYRVPMTGLVIFQLSPRALLKLLSPDAAARSYGESIRLDRRIVGRVRAAYESTAGAINVMGYVAGKHPQHARDLVLVCADLDAVSDFAGVQTINFEKFGVGTAALLEVARNLTYVSRRWSLPERSVMVAIWSGSQLGHTGLRYFLEEPTWSLGRITSVIYVGLDPNEEPVVRKLLADKGLSLDVIPAPPDPLYEWPLILMPDPAVRRMARESQRRELNAAAEFVDDPALPDLSAVVDSAVVQARRLADAAYGRLLLSTTHPRPFYPAFRDTLKTPQDAGDESL